MVPYTSWTSKGRVIHLRQRRGITGLLILVQQCRLHRIQASQPQHCIEPEGGTVIDPIIDILYFGMNNEMQSIVYQPLSQERID